MWQGPVACQSRKLGVLDKDAWRFAALECDAHRIFATEGRRPIAIIPDQSCRVQPACPRTNRIGAQKYELLRRCQIRVVTRKHLVPEERVGANLRRIGWAGEREPNRRRDVELFGRAGQRNVLGAGIHNFAHD